ncbi:MAG: nuclear transport factor 2 family protein [Candidatus Binatia bacterium]
MRAFGGLAISVRLAAEELLSEFSARLDEGRADTVHELFVENGCIVTPQFTLANREEIRRRFTDRARDTRRRTRHYWSNARFSGDETEITVVTNVMTAIAVDGEPTIVMGGTSADVIVPANGGWAFRSRTLEVSFEGILPPVAAP